MTFKVSDNQYGRGHPSDSWASCHNSGMSCVCLVILVLLKPDAYYYKIVLTLIFHTIV